MTWKFDCDALIVGLTSSRPTIFLRETPEHSRRRRRLTLAHELGHLVIPWHLGRVACHALSMDDAPNTAARGAISAQIAHQESEATRFASSLLVPQDVLIDKSTRFSLQELFESLDDFDVSTMAGILALKAALLPGFCFLFDDGEVQCVNSSGTLLPDGAYSDARRLRALAHERGVFQLGGRDVRWYLLAKPNKFERVLDDRTTSEILKGSDLSYRLRGARSNAPLPYRKRNSVRKTQQGPRVHRGSGANDPMACDRTPSRHS